MAPLVLDIRTVNHVLSISDAAWEQLFYDEYFVIILSVKFTWIK